MGQAVQPAAAARRVHYERRRPEDTVLYQLVQEHLETDLPDPTKGVPTHRGQDRRHHGSAANLNIHLHCLVLDGVYRTPAGVPVFHAGHAPTGGELQVLLTRIIKRLMKLLTRKGYLIEEGGMTYLADPGPETALGPRRAGGVHLPHCLRAPRGPEGAELPNRLDTRAAAPVRCADAQGFSLHAEVCCAAHERKKLEHLCRYITRPAIANERLALNRAGQVVLTLKTPDRDGTTHVVMSPLEFMQRLAALVPRPRLHLIRFYMDAFLMARSNSACWNR